MTLENLLMSVGRIHIAKQRIIIERNLEMQDLVSSFMMNQVTPHLGAWLCLINKKIVIIVNSPKWALHLHLSGRLARE